jgi:uncharacterized protein YcbX
VSGRVPRPDGGDPADAGDPRIGRLLTYPVKSLDPHERDRARLVGGALAGDRRYALVDADGNYVNGKRERAVHRLRTTFEPGDDGPDRLTVRAPDWDGPEAFGLDAAGRDRLCDRLSAYVGYEVSLVVDDGRSGGFPDDTAADGPTVISTATLREVAGWFDGIDGDGMRRRLRANVELAGVPPFFEDRLFADRGSVVAFDVGDVRFEGVNPCQRCVVPTRDPETGAETPGFRETFVERRAATLPEWSRSDRFDHFFRLMVNTRVPASADGSEIAVGDPVRLVGVRDE